MTESSSLSGSTARFVVELYERKVTRRKRWQEGGRRKEVSNELEQARPSSTSTSTSTSISTSTTSTTTTSS
ncbi:hypothetical protein M0804_015212 [Polistes exclamans]|nr:hypothetical protein M0804_015213 [Polistes exclamans]KAI4473715.1 hypothetical protein M0804_015212 [Polistes exclamans]